MHRPGCRHRFRREIGAPFQIGLPQPEPVGRRAETENIAVLEFQFVQAKGHPGNPPFPLAALLRPGRHRHQRGGIGGKGHGLEDIGVRSRDRFRLKDLHLSIDIGAGSSFADRYAKSHDDSLARIDRDEAHDRTGLAGVSGVFVRLFDDRGVNGRQFG